MVESFIQLVSKRYTERALILYLVARVGIKAINKRVSCNKQKVYRAEIKIKVSGWQLILILKITGRFSVMAEADNTEKARENRKQNGGFENKSNEKNANGRRDPEKHAQVFYFHFV